MDGLACHCCCTGLAFFSVQRTELWQNKRFALNKYFIIIISKGHSPPLVLGGLVLHTGSSLATTV